MKLKWLLKAGLCCAALWCLSAAALAAPSERVEALLSQVRIAPVMDSGSFTVDDVEFRRLLVPGYIVDKFAESANAVKPGEAGDLVRRVKLDLYSNDNFPNNEFVTYSQVRPPNTQNDLDPEYFIPNDDYESVVYYFDEHLATLLDVIYQFCGWEDKEPVLDDLTLYVLQQLPRVSKDMRQDIERLYKYTLAKTGTQGTVSRSGELNGLYYFAQTDPDWADMIFEYNNNGDTVRDRGCGCACAAMLISTYHKVEITPRWTRNIALNGDWPVDYGLPNDYFHDVVSQYYNFEWERYGTLLYDPKIIPKASVDIDELARQVGEEGYMAIIHVVAGAFTSQEHYMVLADYEEIDGRGYFLVADPYEMRSRYSSTDQMRETGRDQEGLIYAAKELIYRDCKSIILFEQDRNEFPVFSKCTVPEVLPAPEA